MIAVSRPLVVQAEMRREQPPKLRCGGGEALPWHARL